MLHCMRCDYEWRTRIDAPPKACPACRSKSWNTPAGKKGTYCPECPHCNPAPAPRRNRPVTPDAQTTLDRFNAIDVSDDDAGILAALKGDRA